MSPDTNGLITHLMSFAEYFQEFLSALVRLADVEDLSCLIIKIIFFFYF